MIKEALEWVKSQTRPELVAKDNRQFVVTAAGGLVEIGGRPSEDPFSVSTLTGLADLIKGLGGLKPGQFMSVGGPPDWKVDVYADAHTADRRRDLIASCEWLGSAELTPIRGVPGQVVLEAQVAFDPSPERDRLLRSLQSIVDVSEVRVADDGVNQEVSGKARVGMLEWGEVKNPFELMPRVIYDEVEAPTCPYVLRFEKNAQGIVVLLHPIKGTAWQTQGVRSIVDRLRHLLPEHAASIVG